MPDDKTLTLTVDANKIREFADAIRDWNPIYRDEAAAKAAGFPCIPAPPTFYEVWLRLVDFPVERTPRPRPTGGGGGGFDGGREIEYLKPVYAGDVITIKRRPGGSYEREGRRGGKLTFNVEDCEFTNQRGEKVLVVKNVAVRTSQVPEA
jgi:acyl dehydratase